MGAIPCQPQDSRRERDSAHSGFGQFLAHVFLTPFRPCIAKSDLVSATRCQSRRHLRPPVCVPVRMPHEVGLTARAMCLDPQQVSIKAKFLGGK